MQITDLNKISNKFLNMIARMREDENIVYINTCVNTVFQKFVLQIDNVA